ncbi:hypothetical protein NDU88_006653 [Pleurodeles waltl]|uniref:Uncharacterized protein n=1 Tax=Pleurodeles waltl TaxID=8319 RepID=A0AAV7VNC7_PLEWA|nr:hypothetical protein NDU88_006653 [Pleurodeles waltl]
MADERVQRALLLLEEAGCMDLVKTEALSQFCLARKASQGVAGAGAACARSEQLHYRRFVSFTMGEIPWVSLGRGPEQAKSA